MKTFHWIFCLMLLGASAIMAVAQSSISTPQKRQLVLDGAQTLLKARPDLTATLPTTLVDPFNPPSFGTAPAAPGSPTTPPISSDQEILAKIAPHITPSGMMMFDGQPLLLFREKKLKVGDDLIIAFEGRDYVVVVTEINSSSFKIRLNHAEIIRPINPGRTP